MAERAKSSWDQMLEGAGTRAEDELRKVIQYINDKVVPEVRRNGSDALRFAAAEMQRLAQRMDDRAQKAEPPKDAAKP